MACKVIAGHDPTDGVPLYQCSSLNIIEKGPMVNYGVPTDDP